MIASTNRTTIRDADGRARVLIENREAGPVAILYGADGQPAGGLSFSDEGGLVVTLTNADGRARAALLLADGEPTIVAIDSEGNAAHARHALERPAEISDLLTSCN